MTDRKAIALYYSRLGGVGGGAERMVCQLASALAVRGFDVHLISWDPEGASAFYPIDPTISWIKLGFARGYIDKLRRLVRLRDVLREHDVKVLVGFVMSGDRTVFGAAKLAGVKLIAAERNAPAMYRFRGGSLQQWATFHQLALADLIAVQMETYTAGYPRYLRKKIVVIPNPVSIVNRRAKPEIADENGVFTILAVSRLDPLQKRISCLVGAFSLLAERFPQWRLRIIGDGPDENNLRRRIEAAHLAERVRIEPSTPSIFEAYLQSHLFAIPSLWEGFPNALAEAMSHGLPAVGFAGAAGVAEIIGLDGGWLAEGLDDEGAFAGALALGMSDSQGRLDRGQRAARRMMEFTPDQQFDRWADLLYLLIRG